MIVLVCDWFPIYDRNGVNTNKKEFVASHGICLESGKVIVVTQDHPKNLGAYQDRNSGEWILN